MKNEQVVENYFRGINCHSLNVYSIGDSLINYETIMVRKIGDEEGNKVYCVNIAYYSTTTSKIQSYIKNELQYITDKIIYYYGNKYGDNFLDESRQVKIKAVYSLSDSIKIGVSRIFNVNCNESIIQFYYFYNNVLIGDVIERKLKYDSSLKEYFRYYNRKIYLDELQLQGITNIIDLVQ